MSGVRCAFYSSGFTHPALLKKKKKKAYQNIEVFRIINLLGFVLQRDMKIYDILCGFCRATMWNIAALYV